MSTPNPPPRPMPGWSLRPIEKSDLARDGSPDDIGGDGLEYDNYELGWSDRIRNSVGRVLPGVGWVLLVAGLAFGSAGIVAATEHLPSSGTRPELTYGADLILSTKLDPAVRDLATLKDDVDSLSDMARKTLAAMAQINRTDLQAAWDGGWNDINSIDAGAADLKSRLNCGAWASTLQLELTKTNSPEMVDRYHSLCVAIDSVAPLHAAWQSIVDGSATAIRVVDDIETHDSQAADALESATAGRYQDGLNQLVLADDSLADAATIAQTLAATGDVSTLTTWLARTKAFDDNLGVLWQTMIDSKGKVTAQVTAALRAVDAAKALLPQNSDALQVVLYEAAGSLTTSGISIETARGALGDAVASLTLGSVVGR